MALPALAATTAADDAAVVLPEVVVTARYVEEVARDVPISLTAIEGEAFSTAGLTTDLFDGGRLNNRHQGGLRGQLLWTPRDDLSGRLIAEFGRLRERCCAYRWSIRSARRSGQTMPTWNTRGWPAIPSIG